MNENAKSNINYRSWVGRVGFGSGTSQSRVCVTVFERDESPTSRPQGHRIFIRSMGMHALTALLTPEKLSRLSTAKVTDVGGGFTCANEKMEAFFSVQGQEAGVQFLRAELRNFLQEGLYIEWNKRMKMFEDNGYQVIAHFEDGSHATGDLLVGCDGSASTVRELLPLVYKNNLGSIPKVVDSNQAVLGAQIDRTIAWETLLPLNKTGFVRYLGINSNDIGVCFSERLDRTPTVFWAFSEEIQDRHDPWYQFDQGLECRQSILNHCRQLINNEPWHENLKKLVNDTPAEAIMAPWLIRTTKYRDSDKFPMVPTGRVTLLGDSAHAMSNARGLGGNNVLEDARLLSALLAASPNHINWPKLIEQYEREMFARARIAVQESENAAEYFRKLRMN